MRANKKVPMRKCVGCQEMKSKKEMIRVLKIAGRIHSGSQQDERTDAVHICARKMTALQKQ